MPHKFRHSAVCFAIVLVAYLIYARVAVPFIEPSIAGHPGTIADAGAYEPSDDQSITQLESLFPPGTFDLKKTKVLKNDRVILLLEEYDNSLGDGQVKLKPCTMIKLWDGPADDEAQRLRQSIILEAPQGAILKFDKPIDLSSLRIGRLVGGSLLGPITIRSQGKSLGPEDDLLIRTNDVQLNEQKVWTQSPVDFAWGKNSGRGRDMQIKLLTDPSKIGNDRNAPNVTGIEIFELQHIESLHLASTPIASARTVPAPKQTNGFTTPTDFNDLPVEITCNGAFTFNVVKRVATFADKVNVMRVNPNGPSDQIQSELLSIYFTPRDNAKSNSDNSSDLEPERIEARGHPVVINAPTKNLTGQGERLEYNVKTNLISLDGGPEVYLRQGTNEIHGRSLQYQLLGTNRLGSAKAQGPGWIRGQMAGETGQILESRWNDELKMYPQDQSHVITFTGGAILDYAGIGRLEAKEISFWLKESPSGGPPNQSPLPDKMLAKNQVTLNSSKLCIAVDQLAVWFVPKDLPQPSAFPAPASPANQKQEAAPLNPNQNMLAPAEAGERHFKISGGNLEACIQLQDQQISDLRIENGVRLEELQTSHPNEKPILIQGDRLEGKNVSSPNATISVTGSPAHIEAQGMGLTGSNINLNRGTNHLWITGPGRMDLQPSSSMIGKSLVPGQPIALSGTLLIDWQKSMDFDGRTAKFEESVSAAAPQVHLQTKILEVKLKNPINFSDPKLQNQNQTELEELRCYGGAFLENRSLDAQQQLNSYERMQVTDLAVNMQSGALTAGGPGWLNRVNLGSMNPTQNQLGTGLLVGRPAAPMANSGGAMSAQVNNQLYCLHIRFQDSITGNLRQGELTFNDQIRAAYTPVFDWSAMIDPDKQETLGPKAITLISNSLKVNQMSLPTVKGQTIEVEASGNAVVEGNGGVFTARAQRIGFSEAKELLTLEGNGRTYAELYQQPQPGAPFSTTAAQKFQYNLKTKAIKIINARSLEISPGKN
jgi:lipopolysaccharide export system protein LptA